MTAATRPRGKGARGMTRVVTQAHLWRIRKVLESPVFWAALLQAVGAVVVALIGRV